MGASSHGFAVRFQRAACARIVFERPSRSPDAARKCSPRVGGPRRGRARSGTRWQMSNTPAARTAAIRKGPAASGPPRRGRERARQIHRRQRLFGVQLHRCRQ
jgi:hypothetical protein